jgi:hypothetical protein
MYCNTYCNKHCNTLQQYSRMKTCVFRDFKKLAATHCITLPYALQHVATHPATHSATHCSSTHTWDFCLVGLNIFGCNTLHHTTPHCNTLQHTQTHTATHTATHAVLTHKIFVLRFFADTPLRKALPIVAVAPALNYISYFVFS